MYHLFHKYNRFALTPALENTIISNKIREIISQILIRWLYPNMIKHEMNQRCHGYIAPPLNLHFYLLVRGKLLLWRDVDVQAP